MCQCIITFDELFICLLVLLYLIGVICFAAGWGSERVVVLCGTQSVPFVSADCTNGMFMMRMAIYFNNILKRVADYQNWKTF